MRAPSCVSYARGRHPRYGPDPGQFTPTLEVISEKLWICVSGIGSERLIRNEVRGRGVGSRHQALAKGNNMAHSNKLMCGAVAFVVALSLLSAPAAADVVLLLPSQDARIISDTANSNYGADPLLSLYQSRDRSLLQFDLSAIPTPSTVNSATLTTTAHTEWGSNPSNQPMDVFRVTQSWIEGTDEGWNNGNPSGGVSWNNRSSGNPWTNAGGDAVGTTGVQLSSPYATSNINPPNDGPITWDVTSLVQEWLDGTHSNFGLEILSGPNNSVHLHSKEEGNSALRPSLSVDYTTAPEIIPEPSTFLVWSLLAALGIGSAAYRRKR